MLEPTCSQFIFLCVPKIPLASIGAWRKKGKRLMTLYLLGDGKSVGRALISHLQGDEVWVDMETDGVPGLCMEL